MRSRSLLDSKSLLALSVGDLESWVSGLNQLTTNQPTGNLVPEFESQTLRHGYSLIRKCIFKKAFQFILSVERLFLF